jgi:hypothetical protein
MNGHNPDGVRQEILSQSHPIPTHMSELKDSTLKDLDNKYGEPWEPPLFFSDSETSDIPAQLLPGIFGEYAGALATATETPEALTVMVILGVLSIAVTKKFIVSPKEGWQESLNIYTLIALPPANHKSLVIKNCTQPLIEWEYEQKVLKEKDIIEQQSARKSQELKIDVLRKNAAKEKDNQIYQEKLAEIVKLESNLIIPEVLPQLFANDITPESLAHCTFEQGGRFALFSDEGGVTETLAGLYSKGHANVDILLKGIDGGDVRIYRRDKSYRLNPFLTVVLAVQPAIIQKMAAKGAFTGNGLLERFLYVIPRSHLGYRTHDKPAVSTTLQTTFNQKIKSLLNIPPRIINGKEVAQMLSLTSSAYKTWRDFQAVVEIQLRSAQTLALCQGWGGKLPGFTLRLAALLHLAEQCDQSLIIAEPTMTTAVKLATLLIDHALAAYSLMGMDQIMEDAKEIFKWIKTLKQKDIPFKLSFIATAMRNRKKWVKKIGV